MADESTSVATLRAAMRSFVGERAWEPFHDAKNLAMSLAIEAAEVMEHVQWVRSEDLPAALRDERRRAGMRDEIADVACYLLALCNALDLDLSDAVVDKLRKNEVKYPPEKYHGWYERPPRAGSDTEPAP